MSAALGPLDYTVHVIAPSGRTRPPIAVSSELDARRIAADYYAVGSIRTWVEREGVVIAEWPTPPLPDDTIGRDFARRRRQLDAARAALTAARERGEGAGTLRQLAAEVERLEYME